MHISGRHKCWYKCRRYWWRGNTMHRWTWRRSFWCWVLLQLLLNLIVGICNDHWTQLRWNKEIWCCVWARYFSFESWFQIKKKEEQMINRFPITCFKVRINRCWTFYFTYRDISSSIFFLFSPISNAKNSVFLAFSLKS